MLQQRPIAHQASAKEAYQLEGTNRLQHEPRTLTTGKAAYPPVKFFVSFEREYEHELYRDGRASKLLVACARSVILSLGSKIER